MPEEIKEIVARDMAIDNDADGDVAITLFHRGCQCCATIGLLSPEQADEFAYWLHRAAAFGRMKKRATVAAEGRA